MVKTNRTEAGTGTDRRLLTKNTLTEARTTGPVPGTKRKAPEQEEGQHTGGGRDHPAVQQKGSAAGARWGFSRWLRARPAVRHTDGAMGDKALRLPSVFPGKKGTETTSPSQSNPADPGTVSTRTLALKEGNLTSKKT